MTFWFLLFLHELKKLFFWDSWMFSNISGHYLVDQLCLCFNWDCINDSFHIIRFNKNCLSLFFLTLFKLNFFLWRNGFLVFYSFSSNFRFHILWSNVLFFIRKIEKIFVFIFLKQGKSNKLWSYLAIFDVDCFWSSKLCMSSWKPDKSLKSSDCNRHLSIFF